jgi:hypothetical protein
MCRVPECFTDIVSLSLTGCTTCLKFNNFVSDPIQLMNGTTQGDPPSMIYYTFYNAPLLDTAKTKDELSPGFVNNSMMLAIGDSLASCHKRLKDMMEREGGGFKWSCTHNSPFEFSKTTLMDFPRSFHNSSLVLKLSWVIRYIHHQHSLSRKKQIMELVLYRYAVH